MIASFDDESFNILEKLIDKCKHFHLENATSEEFDTQDMLDANKQTFFGIQGFDSYSISEISKDSSGNMIDFGQAIADLLMAIHNQDQANLTMIMLGAAGQTSVYLSLGTERTTRVMLKAFFPRIKPNPISIEKLNSLLRSHLLTKGFITGIPSKNTFDSREKVIRLGDSQDLSGQSQQSNQGQTQLEFVSRAMSGATWGYMVQAYPQSRRRVIEERMKIIDILTRVTSNLLVEWKPTSYDDQKSMNNAQRSSQTYASGKINSRVKYLIQLLERDLQRHDRAMATGQWTVKALFGASVSEDVQRLGSLLLETLAGPDSRPQPLRTALCKPGGRNADDFLTRLDSYEVSLLIRLLV